MSLRFITIDHFMKLDKGALEYALRTFQKELDNTLALLRDNPEASADNEVLNDLTNVLTWRKVITVRLDELAEENRLTELSDSLSQPLANAA